MVWGAISFYSGTPLVVIRRKFTAHRYVDEDLRPIVLPLKSCPPGLTLQQDNARPHIAHVSTAYLSAYQKLPWPTRLPDLYPIKHVWSITGRPLQLPRDIDDLTH